VKSDGSSIYLSRDVAAAVDRYMRFRFDDMLYVVDNSQMDHLRSVLVKYLFSTLRSEYLIIGSFSCFPLDKRFATREHQLPNIVGWGELQFRRIPRP
jgi:arginyl-tRNA synthetase